MSKITREQFLQDVRTEVESLKANATPEEISKLNINKFNYDRKDNCIYGQMTGSCESARAKELMDSACVRVTDATYFQSDHSFDVQVKNINGEYTGQTWLEPYGDGSYRRKYGMISMVEFYIFLKGASPKNIIDYLRGYVTELDLPLD